LFRIDKSLVDTMNSNKQFVMITPKEVFDHVQQQRRREEKKPPATEQDMLRYAASEAERILQEARDEAAEIRQAASEEGYLEGKEKAQKAMDALIRAQAEDAKRVFSQIEKYKQDLYQNVMDNALALSFNIAEKIVNIHLEKDDTLYVEIAKEAIQALNVSSKFTLRVSRREYDRFFKKGAQWLSDDIGCAPFEVICDPNMAEGGCIVESDEGVVDAGVSVQSGKLKRILSGRTEPDEAL
jgi:flagellar biosynthesis/type III secretory pathway protein FliH